MSKFKIGDVVVRTKFIDSFPHGARPLVVAYTEDTCDVVQFADDYPDVYWFDIYFELYQPEQSEIKPVVESLSKSAVHENVS